MDRRKEAQPEGTSLILTARETTILEFRQAVTGGSFREEWARFAKARRRAGGADHTVVGESSDSAYPYLTGFSC